MAMGIMVNPAKSWKKVVATSLLVAMGPQIAEADAVGNEERYVAQAIASHVLRLT